MNLLVITPELAQAPGVADSELVSQVCEAMIAIYPDGQPVLPWSGYLAQEGDAFVGTCAFKTPPEAGMVEIAYFTFPGNEGRGVATAMARSLVRIAREQAIPVVRAQTLPEENASTTLLRKLEFTLVGEELHPADGRVWEWRLALTTPGTSSPRT